MLTPPLASIKLVSGVLYALHVKEQRKFLDAQVRVKQAMTIVLFVHLPTISFTRGMVKQIWVFVREIVMKILIALQASTVSGGTDLNQCRGVKAREHVTKTTAFLYK